MTSVKVIDRVAALRAARSAAGLKRFELYAHPEDWAEIKKLAAKLQKNRAQEKKPHGQCKPARSRE